jgi:thiol-disulfide isomerase/thioredoxin
MGSFLLSLALSTVALGAPVEVHLFWSATCPDCYALKAFLAELAQEYPELKIVDHEVAFNPENWRIMVTLARAYGLTEEKVPTVFVGNLAISGVGRAVEFQISKEVERCLAQGCPSPMARLPARRAWVLSPLEIVLILGVAFLVLWLVMR